jgi:hypothetical protein
VLETGYRRARHFLCGRITKGRISLPYRSWSESQLKRCANRVGWWRESCRRGLWRGRMLLRRVAQVPFSLTPQPKEALVHRAVGSPKLNCELGGNARHRPTRLERGDVNFADAD